jgi:hypothetical protein
MLQVALEQASAIDSYYKSYFSALKADYLTLGDWKRLRIIRDFLQPFNRATKETEGDSIMIDKVLFIMDVLI